MDKNDKHAASDALVRALTALLYAERSGKATTRQQSALANSRARARELLSANEFDEAVFRALRDAGFDL
jgi:Spy/CpxP family protein refolding chaperone